MKANQDLRALAATFDARSYPEILHYLENALKAGDRDRVALDFRPSTPYAAYFLEETRKRTGKERKRALRVIQAMVTGDGLTVGRPPTFLTADQQDLILRSYTRWTMRIRPLWSDDKYAMVDTLAETPSERRQLSRLVRRPGCRPSDVVAMMVSWETGIRGRKLDRALGKKVLITR